MESTAEALARWAHDYAPTAGDLALAQRSLLDTLAVTLAARDDDLVPLVSGLPDAARWAAVGHVLDFDDLHIESTTHISVVCVPTTLAVGGDARAYLAGAGVMARLGVALGWSHYASGWHTTCTAGAPAAAVAAAVALGLPAKRIATAIALSVPAAGGVQRAFGSSGKSLQVGFAADAGVRAARLAAAGATADPSALDAWLRLVGGDPGRIDVTGAAVPGGLAVKMFPCCYALQCPITALREQLPEGIIPTGVTAIEVSIPASTVQPLIHHRPRTGLQGKFSLEYAIAAALLDPYPGFSSFTDLAVTRPGAQRLLHLVKVTERPGGGWLLSGPVDITLTLADGSRYSVSQQLPPGSPGRPPSDQDMRTKIADCGEDVPALLTDLDWQRAAAILSEQLPGMATTRAGVLPDNKSPDMPGHARPRVEEDTPTATAPGRFPLPPPPLTGVTVVSLEQAVAAPFATRQLADLGARVIKIERPDGGDFARRYDESVHGQSSYFVWLNRSKESLTLDVRATSGRAVLDDLLARADVLVQNLGPGAAARLSIDAASLADRHPRVISCTISGYGTDGPWANRKAYDLLVQSETGLVSVTGTPSEVAKAGISVADIAAGMYAYSGILTALYRRATTGWVSAVEVSLFEALAEWMGSPAYYTQYGGGQPARAGAQHATIAPYGPFTTADEETVLLAIQNEREWHAFCQIVLNDPTIAGNPQFATNSARVANRDALNNLIEARLTILDTGTALKLLDKAGVANARLNSVAQFLDHPVLVGRDRWRTVATPGGDIQALLPPATLTNLTPVMNPVPALGEHTEDILRSLGRSDTTIAALRADGVI